MSIREQLPSVVLEGLLAARHSCRAFLPDEVPQDIVERIVSLAQRTASWCNAQPWQVVITRGAATDRFREVMLAPSESDDEKRPDFEWPREYQGVYQERRRECGLALYDAVGVARGDREASTRQARENFRLFGAPHVAIITSDEALSTYGAVDCGGYVANFMLAATSLGVATIAQAALAARPHRVRECLGLPASRRIVCGISFGYPDTHHPANGFRTSRAELSSAVKWLDA
ncbi:nitroreductase [Cupriavidus metallidurans]|uniref:Nitroreductase n=1 Tax=Cupriavidus metallidurans (strain ATCC 43123 / DSM 2839 / NBRC 102507 / CH34) TaxID=266264 RepID=Q1LBT4_CUPMC|nr:nitroreductase [Cupriavidus metallidurans]ABF12392.1 nitroreductase [Cupriavidus metallidurans CH34]QGS32379.1 nitroreductase [Cupriavidus metallidurans]